MDLSPASRADDASEITATLRSSARPTPGPTRRSTTRSTATPAWSSTRSPYRWRW